LRNFLFFVRFGDDLMKENDIKTKLNIHPFALMDGTMRDYLDLDVHE
jgi:hypothetical protein